MTGQARSKSGLKAPATSGAENFERMYRVQVNTLETLVVFLPSLFVAAKYWPSLLVSCLGLVYIIGRFIYWRAYIKAPAGRSLGFLVSMLPTFVLLILAFVGALLSIMGGEA